MMPLHFDSTEPAFLQAIRKRIAVEFRDECRQLHNEAEDTYCKYANARCSPENDARYKHAKRNMQVTRGMLAEAEDIVNTYRATSKELSQYVSQHR